MLQLVCRAANAERLDFDLREAQREGRAGKHGPARDAHVSSSRPGVLSVGAPFRPLWAGWGIMDWAPYSGFFCRGEASDGFDCRRARCHATLYSPDSTSSLHEVQPPAPQGSWEAHHRCAGPPSFGWVGIFVRSEIARHPPLLAPREMLQPDRLCCTASRDVSANR